MKLLLLDFIFKLNQITFRHRRQFCGVGGVTTPRIWAGGRRGGVTYYYVVMHIRPKHVGNW